MRLKKFEIRMSVSQNLYEKILQEARNRDTTMAMIAREKLAKYFLSTQNTTLQNQNNDRNTTSIPSIPIQQTEKKLMSAISKIEKISLFTEERLQLLIIMINHFYFDLMYYLPNIPEEILSAALSNAQRRHSLWLKKCKVVSD